MRPSPLLPAMVSRTGVLLLLPLVLLCACGSGGGGGSSPAATLDLTLEDAPLEGLLALRATVESAVLVREDGSLGTELLPGPTEVEFLGLQDRSLWLGRVVVPAGRYLGLDLRFEEGSIEAESRQDGALRLNVTSHELRLRFPQASDLNGSLRLRADLDVARSLRGKVERPPLEFQPSGSLRIDAADSMPIEPFGATYLGREGGEVLVRARRGRDGQEDASSLRLRVDESTLLLGPGGAVAELEDWAELLSPGISTVEVQAELSSGASLRAQRLVLVSQDGSGMGLRVDALLMERAKQELDLLVQEAHGEDSRRALESEPDPRRPLLALPPGTPILLADGTLAGTQDLQIGQRLELRFRETESGLEATLLTIETPARVEVAVIDASGLPDHAIVHLRPDDPWVQAGLVRDENTDVRLDLRSARVTVENTDTEVQPEDLGPGSILLMQGALRGSPDAPDFEGRRGTLRQGEVVACVTDAFPGRGRFECRVASVLQPFSRDELPPGLLTVQLQDFTRVSGAASDAEAFFSLWSNLAADELLRVRVVGLQRPRDGVVIPREMEVSVGELYRDGAELWPPNHRLVAIDLRCEADLRDAQGRPLTDVRMLSITQDEPIDGQGDGNTAPDAITEKGGRFSVRAERAGSGNGRVYAIHYEARNADGERVEGSFHLTVPKSQNGEAAIDDGQDYDSTDEE